MSGVSVVPVPPSLPVAEDCRFGDGVRVPVAEDPESVGNGLREAAEHLAHALTQRLERRPAVAGLGSCAGRTSSSTERSMAPKNQRPPVLKLMYAAVIRAGERPAQNRRRRFEQDPCEFGCLHADHGAPAVSCERSDDRPKCVATLDRRSRVVRSARHRVRRPSFIQRLLQFDCEADQVLPAQRHVRRPRGAVVG